jgi:hypothetical protein
MNNRQLVALSRELQGKSAAEVDRELRRRRLDTVDRIAVKHAISAAAVAGGRTVRAALATDGAEYQPHQEARPRNAMDRLMERSNIDPAGAYTELELGKLLERAGLTPEDAIAVKIECAARGITRRGSVADTMLQQLGIEGPMDLMALERLLDQRGVASVAARTCVRAELQRRGWLKGGGSRSMRASAATGTPLVDGQGHSITLKSRL